MIDEVSREYHYAGPAPADHRMALLDLARQGWGITQRHPWLPRVTEQAQAAAQVAGWWRPRSVAATRTWPRRWPGRRRPTGTRTRSSIAVLRLIDAALVPPGGNGRP
jgi:hypothetical protein